MERVNPITLTMENGTEYTLEFSRKTVADAERHGFVMEQLGDKPATLIPQLFYHSFKMHHPTMTQEQTRKILDEDLGGLTPEMIERLGVLYAQGLESLINEGTVKNSKVTITM